MAINVANHCIRYKYQHRYPYIYNNKIRSYVCKNSIKHRFNTYISTNASNKNNAYEAYDTYETYCNYETYNSWDIHSYMSSALKEPADICKAALHTVKYEKNNKIIVINSICDTDVLMQDIINKAESNDILWKKN